MLKDFNLHKTVEDWLGSVIILTVICLTISGNRGSYTTTRVAEVVEVGVCGGTNITQCSVRLEMQDDKSLLNTIITFPSLKGQMVYERCKYRPNALIFTHPSCEWWRCK